MSTERFLKQRGVNIAVAGQYSLPNWYDPQGKLRIFACRTTRVSPYRMTVDVPVVGKVGDYLDVLFPRFWQARWPYQRHQPGCFLLELDMTDARREKLANKLTWLEAKLKDPSILDLRKEVRASIPANSHSTLTLADGAIHPCFIIDMSVGGRRGLR